MTSPTRRPETTDADRQAIPAVYLDPDVILAQPGSDRVDEQTISSDAREPLQTLAETGHELVLVSDRPVDLPDAFPPITETDSLEGDRSRGAWFLTADPEHCGQRRAGLRSILVGPGPATRMAEIHRCDLRSRDLRSAVIEILSREAMAQGG
jgi:hypothetical protein